MAFDDTEFMDTVNECSGADVDVQGCQVLKNRREIAKLCFLWMDVLIVAGVIFAWMVSVF